MSFASGSRGGRIAERLVERNGFRPLKWKFAWDGRDHLAHTITPDDHKWAYQYDPFRRRNSKTQYILADNDPRPGEPANRQWQEVSQHSFLWDGDVLVWEDVSGAKTEWHFEPDTFVPLAKRTVAVLDDPGGGAGQGKRNAADGDRQALAPSRANGSAATNGGAKEARLWYVVTDHLGTPRELLSEDGTLVWAAEYTTWGSVRRLWQADNDTGPLGNFQGHDPDGNPVYSTRVYGTDGSTALKPAENPDEYACPIRFQGQWADEETGLYYNRFRYYDPAEAQYMSPDPIGLSGGIRSSSYAAEPTTWVDPLGLSLRTNLTNAGQGLNVPWQAHHLIPCAVWGRHRDMFDAVGLLRDHASYGLALPTSTQDGINSGSLVHKGPHAGYNNRVERQVQAIEDKWKKDKKCNKKKADAAVKRKLIALQQAYRGYLKGLGALNPRANIGDVC